MKRFFALLTAVCLLPIFCACSAKFPAPDTPEGHTEYKFGPLHLYCPDEEYENSEKDGRLTLANSDQTAFITVSKEICKEKDLVKYAEEYGLILAKTDAEYYDSLYEQAYGLPFDTACTNQKALARTMGNGKCVCLSYDIKTTATLVAITMTASFYHIICAEEGNAYILTFCVVSGSEMSAEKHFEDIIKNVFIE